MVERDCSTCARHQQAEPINPFCMSCLMDPTELPRWHPEIDLEAYLVSLDERHEDEPEEPFFPPSQSRKESLLEATLNTLSGFVLSYLVWMLVAAPLFNIPVNHHDTFWITCLFTVVSVGRSYVWRRLFNKRRLANA